MKSLPLTFLVALGLAGCASAPVDDLANVVTDVSQNDSPPVPTVTRPPVYPDELKGAKISGEVVVEFIVAKNGKVYSPKVVRSTNPAFDQPAMDAVLEWEFRPGIKGGKPVTTLLRLPVQFEIAKATAPAK